MIDRRVFAWLLIMGVWLGCATGRAQAAATREMHLEAILVWGTNDPKPKDRDLKELDTELSKKLCKAAPYKWKNYFEVNRKTIKVSPKTTGKLVVSEHCQLEIQNLGEERLEVKLIGEGKAVSKHSESLPMDHIFVLSGPTKDDAAWLVILRQVPEKK